MNDENQNLQLLDGLIGKATQAGADAADAIFVEGVSISLTYRLGKQEHLERSEGADLGLRVFAGKRQAIVSSSDILLESPNSLHGPTFAFNEAAA